jgi:PAH dioxygenase small subunit
METRVDLKKRPVNYNEPLYFEAFGFLQTEAEWLDNKQWKEWLTILSQNLSYKMPVRTVPQNREPGSEFSKDMFHFYDNYKTMELRVKRMYTELAWAEDPASRTRRFITNIRVSELDDNRLEVKSYILLMRSHIDNPKYQMLSAERIDILEPTDSGLKLARRDIYVDQTTLGVENLAVFL